MLEADRKASSVMKETYKMCAAYSVFSKELDSNTITRN